MAFFFAFLQRTSEGDAGGCELESELLLSGRIADFAGLSTSISNSLSLGQDRRKRTDLEEPQRQESKPEQFLLEADFWSAVADGLIDEDMTVWTPEVGEHVLWKLWILTANTLVAGRQTSVKTETAQFAVYVPTKD